MSEKMGITGSDIMFSSNDTPAEEFVLAKKLGANINLDDYTHVQFLKDTCGVPETVFCRYNPGEPSLSPQPSWTIPAMPNTA